MANKQYGIRVTMPESDPLASEHILGPDWESYRWFDNRERRDRIMRDMQREHPYSRPGDKPTIICEKVEREA